MKRNRIVTFAVCLVTLLCMFVVTAFATDCSHVPAEAVQENIVNSTYTKGGSYELVEYCDVCGEELSRTKMKTDKKTLPKVEGITAEAIATDVIKVSWGFIEGADGYRLYMFNYETNKFETVETITSGNVVSAAATNVYAANENIFMVKAYVKEDGKTVWSPDSESVTVHVRPTAPKNLTFTSTASEITFKWDKVEGADGYRIYEYDAVKNKYNELATVQTNKYTVKIDSQGTGMFVKVKAYKKAGGKTLWSEATGRFYAVTKPLPVTDIKYKVSSSGIELIWGGIWYADGYRIYRYNSGTKKWVSIKTINRSVYSDTYSYTVEGVSVGTYKFRIKSFNKAGGKTVWGEASKTIKATTKLAKPDKISLSQTDSSITLKWGKVTGANGYAVFRYTSGEWKRVKTITSPSTVSYTVKNLKAGQTVKFRIKAYKKVDGKTLWSSATSTVTAATKPAAPKITVKSEKPGQITLSWKAVSGAKLYKVYYKVNDGKFKFYKDYTKPQTLTFKNLKGGDKYTFAVKAAINVTGGTVIGEAEKKSVKVTYRTTRYLNAIKSGTYYMSYKMGYELYEVYMAEAMKGNKLYVSTYDDNGDLYRMVYNGSNGKWYVIYDQYKLYTTVNDADLPAESRASEIIKAAKNQEIPKTFKSTKQKSGDRTLYNETAKVDGYTTRYCFEGTKLLTSTVDLGDGTTVSQEFFEFTNKVPDSLFKIPSDYKYVS